jgi:hypothetical protein
VARDSTAASVGALNLTITGRAPLRRVMSLELLFIVTAFVEVSAGNGARLLPEVV